MSWKRLVSERCAAHGLPFCVSCDPPVTSTDLTPLEESLVDTQHTADLLVAQLQALAKKVEVLEQRDSLAALDASRLHRVRLALFTFYRSELSMSSVQPLLTLAEELCPELKSFEKRS